MDLTHTTRPNMVIYNSAICVLLQDFFENLLLAYPNWALNGEGEKQKEQ